MTRTARREKKKHLEASSWSDLKQSVSKSGHITKKKNRKPSKDQLVKTLDVGQDLVKVVTNTNQTKGHGNSKSDKRKKKSGMRRRGQRGSVKSTKQTNEPMDEKRRQRIEKRRLRRAKMKECFGCRKTGHRLEDCPQQHKSDQTSSTGICFKCGSTEHGVSQCKTKLPPGTYPFATCFICGEKGHLTRSCPDNPKGLYPHGGGCAYCGSVEHLKINCPEKHSSKKGVKAVDSLVQLKTNNFTSADADTTITPRKNKKVPKKLPKTVKF